MRKSHERQRWSRQYEFSRNTSPKGGRGSVASTCWRVLNHCCAIEVSSCLSLVRSEDEGGGKTAGRIDPSGSEGAVLVAIML